MSFLITPIFWISLFRSSTWANTRLQLLAYPFTVLNSVVPILVKLLGLSASLGFIHNLVGMSALKGPEMAGFVGLAVSLALALPSSIGAVMWSLGFLEQKMCSVQRVREIALGLSRQTDIPSLKTHYDRSLAICDVNELPTIRTGVRLENVEVSYQTAMEVHLQEKSPDAPLDGVAIQFRRENLPSSLRNVTATAGAGEHIGVIGKTGAGI